MALAAVTFICTKSLCVCVVYSVYTQRIIRQRYTEHTDAGELDADDRALLKQIVAVTVQEIVGPSFTCVKSHL